MPLEELRFDYSLEGSSEDVVMSFSIGLGQTGVSKLFLDATPIQCALGFPAQEFHCSGSNFKNAIRQYKLGNANEMVNKTLMIRTKIQDVQPNSDKASVNIWVTGGAAEKKVREERTLPTHGTIDFITIVNFTG